MDCVFRQRRFRRRYEGCGGEDKLLYTEVCINGQKIQQGLGQRTVNAFSENPITVEDFTIGEEVNTEGTVNIEFKVWPIAMDDADTWKMFRKYRLIQNLIHLNLRHQRRVGKNTVDLNLNQNIKMDSNVLNLTEFRWNPFERTQFTECIMEQYILTVIIICLEQTIRETKSAIRKQEEMVRKLCSGKR